MIPFHHAASLSDSIQAATSPANAPRAPIGQLYEDEDTNKPTQLTPTDGRIELQRMRPQVSSELDEARARGRKAPGPGLPSRFPGEQVLYVGSSAHAANVALLQKLQIGAVLNCAPAECKAPVGMYKQRDIAYLEVDAIDDRTFPLLMTCLRPASDFIQSCHAQGRGVLVHSMAGVNRSATLALAHLMIAHRRNLIELFAECINRRPSILQNPSFQLQLCALAHRQGLLSEPDESTVSRALSPPTARSC